MKNTLALTAALAAIFLLAGCTQTGGTGSSGSDANAVQKLMDSYDKQAAVQTLKMVSNGTQSVTQASGETIQALTATTTSYVSGNNYRTDVETIGNVKSRVYVLGGQLTSCLYTQATQSGWYCQTLTTTASTGMLGEMSTPQVRKQLAQEMISSGMMIITSGTQKTITNRQCDELIVKLDFTKMSDLILSMLAGDNAADKQQVEQSIAMIKDLEETFCLDQQTGYPLSTGIEEKIDMSSLGQGKTYTMTQVSEATLFETGITLPAETFTLPEPAEEPQPIVTSTTIAAAFTLCKQAASTCATQMVTTGNASCDECYSYCADQAGYDLIDGANGCGEACHYCLAGNATAIKAPAQ